MKPYEGLCIKKPVESSDSPVIKVSALDTVANTKLAITAGCISIATVKVLLSLHKASCCIQCS